MAFETPILFLVFNRLETTKQVFERIREIAPKYLYIAADGSRTYKPGEKIITEQVRDYLMNSIDWPCEVKTLFREHNLGCGRAVCEAITWFFGNVEMGIILEDDVLPSLSFFNFAQELLVKYENDEDIAFIAGTNINNTKIPTNTFLFSKYGSIWGWATWKRTWSYYNFSIEPWKQLKTKIIIEDYINNEQVFKYYNQIFDNVESGKIDTWAYQFLFYNLLYKKIVCVPKCNLISNIGFSNNATHTLDSSSILNSLPSQNVRFPLVHPKKKVIDNNFDKELLIRHGVLKRPINYYKRIKNKIHRIYLQLYKNIKIRKWKDIEYFDEAWKGRIQQMAKYIPANSKVMDLGCGQMWLKDYLINPVYVPVDYKRRDENTVICNFNNYQFPDETADFIFISGTLEYVLDYNWFINKVCSSSNNVILSYCCLEEFSDLKLRREFTWVNDLSYENIIGLFKTNSFELNDLDITDTKNRIFKFERIKK